MPRIAGPLYMLAAAAATALLFSACDSDGTRPPGSITGTVTAEGEPVPGAVVRIEALGLEATADASGNFSFPDLEPATYEVTLTAWPETFNFTDVRRSVMVTSGHTATANFAGLIVRTGVIEGTVTVDGTGVQGVVVRLEGPEPDVTTTNTNGRFIFSDLRAGEFTVTIEDLPENVEFDQTLATVSLEVGQQANVAFSGIEVRPPEASILHLERPDSDLRFNPDNIRGEADVVVSVDPGTDVVTRLRLFLGDVEVEVRSFEPEGLTEPDEVEIRLDTDAFDSETGEVLFPNGARLLSVEVDAEERGPAAAVATLEIVLANQNRIAGVQAVSVGEGVVSEGRRWFGRQDLTFEVIPVLFDPDRTIGAISLEASGDASLNGGPSLDFGSGPGEPHQVEGPPFVFTASLEDNDGLVEDEPDGIGHTIRVDRVFDEDGVEITSDFVPNNAPPLEGFYVDFVAPVVDPGAAITVGGGGVAGGTFFAAGTFGLSGLSERGSGGVAIAFQVRDADEPDPIADVTSIDDLPERRNDKFTLEIASIADAMGNVTDTPSLPSPTSAFGVDRTPITVSDIRPADPLVLNPDAPNGAVAFNALEPDLPDGSPGSGYETTSVTAEAGDGTVTTVSTVSPDDLGMNTIDLSGLSEGPWTVEATTMDRAVPGNETTFSYTVTLDRTDPTTGVSQPPPNNITATAGSVTLTFQGTATDDTGLSLVRVSVRDDTDDGDPGTSAGNGACELTDPLLPEGDGPGEVDQNEVNVTDQVLASDEGAFSEDFRFTNAGSQQRVCFFVEAFDLAEDRNGNSAANESATSTTTVINWN